MILNQSTHLDPNKRCRILNAQGSRTPPNFNRKLPGPHSSPLLRANVLPTPRSPASSPTASTAGKRVKFASDAPATSAPGPGGGDEDLDDLDLTDSTAARKRTAVVTDGYDSDSSAGSDGGFGVGGGRKGGKDKEAAADGDDDDMFGGGAEKEKVKAEKPGKEFLEMGDIEGQEFGRGDEGDEGEGEGEEEEEEEEEDYLPDDDLANDDDAPRSRRKKTGMGFKLRRVWLFSLGRGT